MSVTDKDVVEHFQILYQSLTAQLRAFEEHNKTAEQETLQSSDIDLLLAHEKIVILIREVVKTNNAYCWLIGVLRQYLQPPNQIAE